MSKLPFLILFLFIASVGFSQDKGKNEQILKSFSTYKQALVDGKSSDAFELLSSSSVEYYNNLLSLILFAPKIEVENMSLIDRMTILASRHRVPMEQIKTMNARDFFVYAMDQSMLGKSSVQGLEIGEIRQEGTNAYGKMMTNGIETPVDVVFNKEDGIWKVDMTSMYPAVSEMLGKFMSATGQSENEFMFQMIKMMTGDTPSEKVWEPLLQKQ